ncbi:MAG: hypothetical protein H7Y13_01135 [Sphingobacteriaceae bacterium]|nr:hypothetical protein [Sphingobacteriaceae bacterium]
MSISKFYTELSWDEQMLMVCDGIQQVSELNDIKCKEPKFVPVNNWRRLSSLEKEEILASANEKDYYQNFGLVRLSGDIITPADQEILSRLNRLDDINTAEKESLIGKLNDFCSSFQIASIPQNTLGIFVKSPRQESATYDAEKGVYIGLHIDSWFKTTIENRHERKNRICINLGCCDRYLVFVNAPISSIYAQYNTGDNDVRQLIKTYMQDNPATKCYKLRVRPLEAYIFPTESMIHDGRCEVIGQNMDITFTAISYYKLYNN